MSYKGVTHKYVIQYATDVQNLLLLARLKFWFKTGCETGCVSHYFQYKEVSLLFSFSQNICLKLLITKSRTVHLKTYTTLGREYVYRHEFINTSHGRVNISRVYLSVWLPLDERRRGCVESGKYLTYYVSKHMIRLCFPRDKRRRGCVESMERRTL